MKLAYNTMSFGKGEKRITVIHFKKPIKHGFAGMVTSKVFPQNVALVVDSQGSDEREYDLACLAITPGVSAVRIEMDESVFYGIKRGEKFARTILFHELGHYYHDHLKGGTLSISEYDALRSASVDSGKVIQQEVEADAFAVRYLGKDYVKEGLRSIMDVTRNHIDKGIYDTETGGMAIKEIELRMKALQGATMRD